MPRKLRIDLAGYHHVINMVQALKDRYTQIALANYLNISPSLVSKVVKGMV